MPNHAINTDGLGQRARGALTKTAGYGERWTDTAGHVLRHRLTLDLTTSVAL
jgi:hypothetical protein